MSDQPQTASDHHDRAWAGDYSVACVHDNARDGCSGCVHDDAIREAVLDALEAAVRALPLYGTSREALRDAVLEAIQQQRSKRMEAACRHGYIVGTMCSECPNDVAIQQQRSKP